MLTGWCSGMIHLLKAWTDEGWDNNHSALLLTSATGAARCDALFGLGCSTTCSMM